LYTRNGGPYTDDQGRDWPDNPLRFGVLSKVAALFGRGSGLAGWRADIVHSNDWQAGLAPAYLAHDPSAKARSLLGIHNIAFQGNFSPDWMSVLELPWSYFHVDGLEFHGQLSFLKAGIYYADHLVTVSPTYAREILTPEFGFGLDGLLSKRNGRLTGILNGIDTAHWDPGNDSQLAATYGSKDWAGKAINKQQLQQSLNLEQDPRAHVLGMVSRLTYQKGVDLVLGIGETLMEQPVQLVILGSGDNTYEGEWRGLAGRYPRRIGVAIGYDEKLAHLIEAGSDSFLIPSRFEPCGLNQMYSMRYGTIPIVRRTGGLADSVTDVRPSSLEDRTATGFVFEQANRSELLASVLRALLAYEDEPLWRSIQNNGMARDFSWRTSAVRYLELYRHLIGDSRGN
jgi:starch synthase